MKVTSHIAAMAAAMSLLSTAAAQTNTTSKYLVLTTYHVKAAAVDEFADFLKNKWVPAMKKGGATPRIYSSTQASAEAGVFVVSAYADSLSIFDQPVNTLEKGAGAGGYARIQAQRAQMIDKREQLILTRQPEMSVHAEAAKEKPLLLINYVKTALGKQAEFRSLWTKDLVPAVKKAGRTVSVWRVAFGDETQYMTSTPLDSFAEFDKGHSIAQLTMESSAYTAWNSAVQPTVDGLRREVFRLRRDLMGAE